uniref:Uncharacterized protein n=1 Tax=Salix viminalis TaxID=40686 RepID=A0A6N2LFN2_SALVM
MDLKLEERALIAFFESDHDLFCCAVLELVITEEKLDFDLEIEKVFQARSLALQERPVNQKVLGCIPVNEEKFKITTFIDV